MILNVTYIDIFFDILAKDTIQNLDYYTVKPFLCDLLRDR